MDFESINTERLNALFRNTSTSYKFFWFLSLIEEISLQDEPEWINALDIAKDMVALAWHPIIAEDLSMGKTDSLGKIASQIRNLIEIAPDAKISDVEAAIRNSLDNPDVKKALMPLLNNVPYRFLSPWINESNDKKMMMRSQNYENGCIYALKQDEEGLWIIVDLDWWEYIQEQEGVLKGFTMWKLIEYLASKN